MAWWGPDVQGVSPDSAIVGEALNLNGAWLFAMGDWSFDCCVLKESGGSIFNQRLGSSGGSRTFPVGMA